jgi:hypothetical protein
MGEAMPRKKIGYDSFTVHISQEIARKVRSLAIDEGRHLSKMVELLLTDGLANRQHSSPQQSLFNSSNNKD